MPTGWQYILIILLIIVIVIIYVIAKQWRHAKRLSVVFLDQVESIQKKVKPYDLLQKYLEKTTYESLLSEIKNLFYKVPFFVDEVLRGNENYKNFKLTYRKWKSHYYYKDLCQAYISSKLNDQEIKGFFDNFHNLSLDNEQRISIIADEYATLIVAAAGSGKTLTIAAKVAYLVKFQHVDPSKILLITFTNESAKEMEKRVYKTTAMKVPAYTFHKLGLNILTEKQDKKPNIANDDLLDQIINTYFQHDIKRNVSHMHSFIEMFAYYSYAYIDESSYSSRSKYTKEIKAVDLLTLKSRFYLDNQERKTIQGERVKSLAELQIANYLFINGIEYIYEDNYKHDTATKHYKQYQPDFYLPKYDIYIEHFGVDNRNKANWLSQSEEEKYIKSMEWKRGIHLEYHTTCIETFSYMAQKGELLTELEKKLIEKQVEIKPIDQEILLSQINASNTKYFQELKKLIKTFITILKESGKIYENKEQLFAKMVDVDYVNQYRAKLFLNVVIPIFDKYEKHLKDKNLIDFSDMIFQAKNYVAFHDYGNYDYIIIDEYQDISESKSQLINALVKENKTKLFFVGDDWQSIFRFAGSDINQFTSFQDKYKSSIIHKIQTTYRNPQQLVSIASKFIMRNDKQMSKNVVSTRQFKNPIHLYAQNEKTTVHVISEIINNIISICECHEVLIIGRYNFDLDSEELYNVKQQFPDIDIKFLTIHKAKGLEAEHVIIVNNKNHILGFPSKIADDELLKMVLSHDDGCHHSEERRLFYVALTRAKYTCHLIVQTNASAFVEELKKEKQHVVLHGITDELDIFSCPRCDGHLVLRKGEDDDFYGCSNYPYCEYSANKDINLNLKCPECDDYMIRKIGPYGPFMGCNSYKDLGCSGRMNIGNLSDDE